MTKLYISNSTLIRANFATVANKSISGRIQKQTVLMMLSLLLLSFSSFGQTTYYSRVTTGNWNDINSWSKIDHSNTNQQTVAGSIPGSNDKAVIKNGHKIIVNINTAQCLELFISSAQNNGTSNTNNTPGALVISANALLSIVSFNSDYNGSHTQAQVIIRNNGELRVSGANGLSPWTNNYIFDAGSKVTYNGGSAQTVTNLNYRNLDLSGAGAKNSVVGFSVLENLVNSSTFNGGTSSIIVIGNVTNINSGIINAGSSTISIGGNFVTAFNTFIKGTGLVNYSGGNQNAAAVDYHNLQFSGSGIKTATGGLSVASNLDIVTGVTFNAASGTHTIAGNLTNVGTIEAGTSTIKIGGSFSNPNGDTFKKGTGTIEYNGNVQSITPLQYYNLTLTRASGTSNVAKTAGGSIYVANAFAINTGATFAHNSQMFYYNGGAQTVTPAVYNHLTLAGTGTKSAISNLTIDGNLSLESYATFESNGIANFQHLIKGDVLNNGTINNINAAFGNQLQVLGNFTNSNTFTAGPFTHTITGKWTNDGSFTAGTSTIILNGTDKTIKSTNGAFNNLTISNGYKTLYSNVSVDGILNLQDELYTGPNYTLQLNGTGQLASAETATQYITGNVSAFRTIKSGSVAAPTVEQFGNIGISFTNTKAVTADVTIIVTRTTGMSAEGIDGGKVSASRIYNITSGTLVAAPGLQTSFSFLNREMSEAKEKYSLYVERVVDNALKYSSITSTYSSVPADHTYSISDVQHLGRYTIAAAPTPINPQPVELAWFKAQRQAQGVLLTWETASEEENKGFEVQVSTNGKNFDKVAFVESKVVNSTMAQRYSYADNSTVAYGTRYYRLAQVDLDGTTTYSKIMALNMNAAEVAAAAYPNPFADGQQVTVRLPQGGESRSVSVVLTNTHGQVVFAQQAQVQDGQVELAVNTAGAGAKGIYLLNVIDKGTKLTFKLLKK